MNDAPVAIAGGGIAGLATALALTRAGLRVQVYERESSFRSEGAGLQLSPNATRHLRAWGVLDRLNATAPKRIVVRRGSDATVLAAMSMVDVSERFGAPSLVAHRADLHAALKDTLRDAGIAIRMGDAVKGWSEGPPFRVVTQAGSTNSEALVIAEGVHSALRAHLSGDGPVPSGRVAWRALVPAAACPDFALMPASNLWLGPRAHLVHYPLRDGAIVNVVAVIAGESDASDNDEFWSRPGDAKKIEARFCDWSAKARALIGAASDWRVWPLLHRPPPALLVRGRVALVGDAAHPMMPFLAQGAAQAIEDAAALGAAFAQHGNARAAVAAYEKARLARVKRIVAASERQTGLYHLSGVPAMARDAGMRLLGARGLRAASGWIYRG